jgi:endoglucanase
LCFVSGEKSGRNYGKRRQSEWQATKIGPKIGCVFPGSQYNFAKVIFMEWIMMREKRALLQVLSNAFGPSGAEEPVAKLVSDALAPFCQVRRDGLGSVIAEKEGGNSRPRLMLAAHMDEIGFIVQAVTSQGYLRLLPLGGWVASQVPGLRVMIQTERGWVDGVVATVPIHFLPQADKKEVKIEDVLVDIGARSADEVRQMGVRIGDPLVPKPDFTVLNDGFLLNKAWDNRVGVAVMLAAMEHIAAKAHPNTVIGVATVQEEVGCRGARSAVALTRPDLAIVLEGPPADDYPGLSSEPQSALGKGCQIRIFDPTVIVTRPFWRWIVDIAERQGIPYQLAVRKSGGTDAQFIHVAEGGIPTIVLGVPVRYAHAAAGIIHEADFDATVALLGAIIAELDGAVAEKIRF